MRKKAFVILPLAGVLGIVAYRRAVSRLLSSALGKGVRTSLALAAHRHSLTREEISQQRLLQQRHASDEWHITEGRRLFGRLLERVKAEYDLDNAAARKQPPVVNVLIMSGGGDWGAFGAGFLKGWQTVPRQHPLAKPEFDAVTGVSTGTLIAPFAFLGDAQSIDQISNLYRNPEQDWVKQNGLLYFLPDHISFAEVPGLERKIRQYISLEMVHRIAEAGADDADHLVPLAFEDRAHWRQLVRHAALVDDIEDARHVGADAFTLAVRGHREFEQNHRRSP